MNLLDSRVRKSTQIEQARPQDPPSYSVYQRTSWADGVPCMTREQFAQVWEVVLATLKYKDIEKGQLTLNRWRLELSQAWQWHENIERTIKPLCPLAVTGNGDDWVAEEARRPNIFSQYELQNANRAICAIMKRQRPV